jgi:hypothetical protein
MKNNLVSFHFIVIGYISSIIGLVNHQSPEGYGLDFSLILVQKVLRIVICRFVIKFKQKLTAFIFGVLYFSNKV